MNHQPFENWLLSDESLDDEDQKALETHLSECKTCRELSLAWEQVHEAFATQITPTPAPNFVQRWHVRLSITRQQRQQRRMWFLTLGLFGVAGLIFLAIFLLNMNRFNLMYQISQAFANFTLLASRIKQLLFVVKTLIIELPILIPFVVIFSVGSLSAMITLIVTWVSSMIRLYKTPQEGVPVR